MQEFPDFDDSKFSGACLQTSIDYWSGMLGLNLVNIPLLLVMGYTVRPSQTPTLNLLFRM